MPLFFVYLSSPLLFLNWLAPVVEVVWLLLLGEIYLRVVGAAGVAGACFSYALLMIPAVIIMLPGAYLANINNFLTKILGFIVLSVTGLWSYILMAGWTFYVFGYVPEILEDRSIPHILFAYTIATAPFAYMASKETGDNWGATFAVLLNQVSTAALVGMLIFTSMQISSQIIIFVGIILVGYIIGLSSGLLSQISKTKDGQE